MDDEKMAKLFRKVADEFGESNFHKEAGVLDVCADILKERQTMRMARKNLWKVMG